MGTDHPIAASYAYLHNAPDNKECAMTITTQWQAYRSAGYSGALTLTGLNTLRLQNHLVALLVGGFLCIG